MIALIAAIGKNRELGKGGGLIWNLPGDLQFFKETTMGRPIVMGSKTFESLPRILPGREHYVVTRQAEKLEQLVADKPGDKQMVHAVTDLTSFMREWQSKPEKLFVIGGGMVYWETLKYADELYLTEVDATSADADTFFPEFNRSDWERRVLGSGANNDIRYEHMLYTKKKGAE